MDMKQYQRWHDFAIRMANRGFLASDGRQLPRQSREKIAEMVKDFFRSFLGNYTGRGDFPNLINRIHDWDNTAPAKGEKSDCPVGDMMDEFSQNRNPYYWTRGESRYERWEDTWGDRLHCCLRAGLDLASEQSMYGVQGFRAGDLKRMYSGNVPGWIKDNWRDYTKSEHGRKIDFDNIPESAPIVL